MNPSKCVFGVLANKFQDFLRHSKDMDVYKNKSKVISEFRPRGTKNGL